MEWIDLDNPTLWAHCIDVLDHILLGDTNLTKFKDNYPSEVHLRSMRRHLGAKGVRDERFEMIKEDTYKRDYRVQPFDNDSGEFMVERWLDREPLTFVDFKKKSMKKYAITLLMDISIGGWERGSSEMGSRYEKIYKVAFEAESDNAPCRVIAVGGVQIPELENAICKLFMVLKDYDEPIFPGIWGTLKDSSSANDFMNAYMDYVVGTHTSGNGRPSTVDVSLEIDPNEIVLIEPKRLRIGGGDEHTRRTSWL